MPQIKEHGKHGCMHICGICNFWEAGGVAERESIEVFLIHVTCVYKSHQLKGTLYRG